jgi:2-oxoglutarate dehydrogenase E1 component
MFEEFGINAGYVEELHVKWLESPASVEEKWRRYFETHDGAVVVVAPPSNGTSSVPSVRMKAPAAPAFTLPPRETLAPLALLDAEQAGGRIYELINAYRTRGHLYANLDPLAMAPTPATELEIPKYGFSESDLDSVFPTINLKGLGERATLREIVSHLQQTYCGSIGVEFTHIESAEERIWLRERMETARNRLELHKAVALRIATRLTDAELFEQFLAKNFVGQKRFSAEGAESMIAMLDEIVHAAGARHVTEIVFGMAHRGRLNILVNVLGKKVREIFAAFDDKHPDRFLGGGDVKYHLGYSQDVFTSSGAHVHLTMCFNPSHLEWVNPVVEGRVRAKQDRKVPVHRELVIPLLIHGDAAFMGQGIVAETLNLAGLEGYQVGGTIHVVVNNQIGFTTDPKDSRSTRYCTDITRMMNVPVFHVNGEDPEAVVYIARIAVDYRQKFGKDVVIDMFCYRKYGHNEADEPRFTQPTMYKLIDQKPSVRDVYAHKLVSAGILTKEEVDDIAQKRKEALAQALAEAREGDYLKPPEAFGGYWSTFKGGRDKDVPEVDTAVPEERLRELFEKLARLPEGFHAHPKVAKVFQDRLAAARDGHGLDWGAGEHIAFATLLAQGIDVRLTGQDARRGTFTHRHATLRDTETGEPYVPLAHLQPEQGRFDVFDSPLSEAGVLGFEYGYSLDTPDGLVLWEAQFGDFLNTAQVIVDQFISSAEDKWLRLSGLVLLLPHGFEGQGPEHSSARLERFLQLCAEDDMQVCNLTTPAQLFHVLRRQVLRPWRKPLVIMTPKSLLRNKEAVSPLSAFARGRFLRVIEDTDVEPAKVKKVLLCTGKVYYDLLDRRRKTNREDVAIVRLEQLYPLDPSLLQALSPYADGTPLVWVQEEPRNMGAWYFVNSRLPDHIGRRLPLSVVSRDESASPATGSPASHALEQRMLLDAAFS